MMCEENCTHTIYIYYSMIFSNSSKGKDKKNKIKK